jgi:PAS domain S-box-containing protein
MAADDHEDSDFGTHAAELRQSAEFLNLVIDNIPAMVVVKDAEDLRFVFGNRNGDDLTGYALSSVIGKTDFDFFPKDQAEAFIAFDRGVLATGGLHVIPEEPISTRLNGTRILRTIKMPVLDETGKPRYLIAMSEDITERKQAEAALKASEAMAKGLLAASPDAVMAVNAEGKIVLANERFRSMYGYAPEELIGRPATMLTPPDKLEDSAARSRLALAAGNASTVHSLHGLRRDGTEFPMEATFSTHATDEGRLIIISIRDVTERLAAEAQLRQAQKMEAIGNLTGGLAHDFNNLLSIIIGNIDLLREGLKGDPFADELAGQVLSAALRGADLTKRLLAFARRQPLEPRLIDVNDLVTSISTLLNRTLGANIGIAHRLGVGVWPVTADPTQLEACLVNLVTNARDAMPRGGRLIVSTSNRHLDADYAGLHAELVPGDYSLIEVSDTGTGMSPETLSRIFEPFFTTKDEGRGTGLGLAMVFGFMKQSGGHINVYSEVGVGTTFRLYLPRTVTDGPVARAASAAVAVQVGGRETILAVEDNPGLRDLVVRQLSQLGYRCLEAADANAALTILEAETVDLLFTDVIMPGGMSGYELGRETRSRWPGTRVLLTSGFPEEKINGNGHPPWNMRLLTKPYRKEDLARVLREVLDEEI